MSAIGPNAYWVLGSAPCAAGQCATLERTTDAGATFTRIGRNGAGGEMPPVPTTVEDGTTVRDVRFGDAQNGWLYGGAFYTTHDGGSTWSADTALPNDVVDVAAASGHVWAVALSAQNGSESYGVYHATYGSSGTGTWTKVPLGTSIGQPGLAVVKQNAFLLAQAGNRQGEILSSPATARASSAIRRRAHRAGTPSPSRETVHCGFVARVTPPSASLSRTIRQCTGKRLTPRPRPSRSAVSTLRTPSSRAPTGCT
ncbi:MAG TPA: hypothetical protein VII50_05775 [Acidothermaceae bacterium]